MALTLRNITDDMRTNLDRYKKEKQIKTDTRAIEYMVSSYYHIFDTSCEIDQALTLSRLELAKLKKKRRKFKKALSQFIGE